MTCDRITRAATGQLNSASTIANRTEPRLRVFAARMITSGSVGITMNMSVIVRSTESTLPPL